MFKNIRLADKGRVQLRVEVFNVFNRKNYRTIETNLTSSRFGSVTEFEPPRIAQLGAKYSF